MLKVFHEWGEKETENDGGGKFNYDILYEFL
jgi:hypothetical protein